MTANFVVQILEELVGQEMATPPPYSSRTWQEAIREAKKGPKGLQVNLRNATVCTDVWVCHRLPNQQRRGGEEAGEGERARAREMARARARKREGEKEGGTMESQGFGTAP